MQNFRKKMKNNKGFSLVELIIVIAILAILVGILAPQYIKYVEKSRKSSDASNMNSFVSAVKVAAADTDYGTTDSTGAFTSISLLGKVYVIEMSTTGTTVTATTGTDTDLNAAFSEAVGAKWAATKLKSKGWDTAAASTPITATVTIATDGGVTVAYAPTDFDDYAK